MVQKGLLMSVVNLLVKLVGENPQDVQVLLHVFIDQEAICSSLVLCVNLDTHHL